MSKLPEFREPEVDSGRFHFELSELLARDGTSASLQPYTDQYIRLFDEIFKDVPTDWVNPQWLVKQLRLAEDRLQRRSKQITELYPGRPVMIAENTGFITFPKSKPDTATWTLVPPSWELHGELSLPTYAYWERNDVSELAPCFVIANPYFVTDSREVLRLGRYFDIKLPVNQEDAPLRDGFVIEPSIRDAEL